MWTVAEGGGRGRHGRVVIGIGNPDRGADGVGPCVVRLLRDCAPADVRVLESSDASDVIACLEAAEVAYLVDASVSGAPAGTIRRIDCRLGALPQGRSQTSTHGFGPAEAIELARALGQLPPQCVVYAIEADSVGTGEPLSGAMRRAAEQVTERIVAELAVDDSSETAAANLEGL